MPVRTCNNSSVIDALPNTYHQPIGPAAPRGIGCRSTGNRLSLKLSRTSNQRPSDFRMFFMAAFLSGFVERVLQRRIVGRLDFELPGAHAPDAMEQPAR